jgi:GDP-D-mannose 3', 5'-epimerase
MERTCWRWFILRCPAAETRHGDGEVMAKRQMTKCPLVCGAGGFIGGHLVKRLKNDGFWVRGVDLKFREFSETNADDFVVGDLRDQGFCRAIVDRRFDEVYQVADSVTINSNVLDACHKRDIRKIFYSSSACMYPAYNLL